MSLMTTQDDHFVALMTGNIQWWRSTHAGVLTPSGKQKKVPWFLLVRCERGHITVTSSKRPMGMRFRCGKHGFRPGTGTVKCELVIKIIEMDRMEERFGISADEAREIHEAWTSKHG